MVQQVSSHVLSQDPLQYQPIWASSYAQAIFLTPDYENASYGSYSALENTIASLRSHMSLYGSGSSSNVSLARYTNRAPSPPYTSPPIYATFQSTHQHLDILTSRPAVGTYTQAPRLSAYPETASRDPRSSGNQIAENPKQCTLEFRKIIPNLSKDSGDLSLHDSKTYCCRYPCKSGSDEPCSKVFRRQADLHRHEQSVHGIGAKLYQCQFQGCKKTMKRKDSLLRHRLIHKRNGKDRNKERSRAKTQRLLSNKEEGSLS